MCKIILIVFLFTNAGAYNILCLLPYTGKSHHMVFEPLLEELTQRGHQLTVVSFFPRKESHLNRRDVSLVGLAPINLEVIDLSHAEGSKIKRLYEHVPLIVELAKISLELCRKLLNDKVFEEFVRGEGRYDLILVEHFNSDCMLGLIHNYRVPSIGLVSSTLLPWSLRRLGAGANPSYVPIQVLPYTADMNFFERVENALCYLFYNIWFATNIRNKEQEILEARLGRKLPPLEEIAMNTSAVLVNTFPTLNGVVDKPPAFIEVGGIHLHNRSVKPLSSNLEKWMAEATNGVIVLSFGSLVNGSTIPTKKLHVLLNVFKSLPQKVVWKWEADHVPDVPDNVLLVRWLPQYDLLSHPKCVAFITHAGLLSLTEAVSTGVPMLAVPILGDQFGNAEHARKAGVAEVLQIIDFNEESLTTALRSVLSQEMRERAKNFSRLWGHRPISPMEEAVYYVEKTAQFGGLNMATHGRHLSLIQLSLVDVIAFVLSVLLIIPFIFVYLVRRVDFCSNKKKVKRS